MAGANTKKRSRCPNGTRKNKQTGKCEPKGSAANNVKKSNNTKKSKKVVKYRIKGKPGAKERKQKKAIQSIFVIVQRR